MIDRLVQHAIQRFADRQVQPAPVGGTVAGWDLVRADLSGDRGLAVLMGDGGPSPTAAAAVQAVAIGIAGVRDRYGLAKYRTRLLANNGRDALADYLQERADGLVYLRLAIEMGGEHATVLGGLYEAEIATFGAALLLWIGITAEEIGAPRVMADA